jgi:hypothetical protein
MTSNAGQINVYDFRLVPSASPSLKPSVSAVPSILSSSELSMKPSVASSSDTNDSSEAPSISSVPSISSAPSTLSLLILSAVPSVVALNVTSSSEPTIHPSDSSTFDENQSLSILSNLLFHLLSCPFCYHLILILMIFSNTAMIGCEPSSIDQTNSNLK